MPTTIGFEDAMAITGLDDVQLCTAVGNLQLHAMGQSDTDKQMRFTGGELIRFCTHLRLPYRTNSIEQGISLPNIRPGDWRDIFSRCWLCQVEGRRPPFSDLGRRMLETHHIERKPHCTKGRRDWRENWLRTCRLCHAGPLDCMPHAKQLAIKWLFDPCGWKTLQEFLDRWCQIDGLKSGHQVSVDDVEAEEAALDEELGNG